MIASRRQCHAIVAAPNTVCPPRRPFVASDARRHGQTGRREHHATTAFGDRLPTPAMLARVDNLRRSAAT